MPVIVKWDENCRRCIHFAIYGGWVREDFQLAMVRAHDLTDEAGDLELYYIFDVRDARIFPRDVLHRIRRIRPQFHEKAALMIVVGEGTFADALRQLLETSAVDSPARIEQVKTPDDAYALIEADSSDDNG